MKDFGRTRMIQRPETEAAMALTRRTAAGSIVWPARSQSFAMKASARARETIRRTAPPRSAMEGRIRIGCRPSAVALASPTPARSMILDSRRRVRCLRSSAIPAAGKKIRQKTRMAGPRGDMRCFRSDLHLVAEQFGREMNPLRLQLFAEFRTNSGCDETALHSSIRIEPLLFEGEDFLKADY